MYRLSDFLLGVADEVAIEAERSLYRDRVDDLDTLVDRLRDTAEIVRDLETTVGPED